MTHEEFTGITFNDLDPPDTRISRSWDFFVNSTQRALYLPERDCVRFRYLLTQIRLSIVCLSLTFVRRTQGLKLSAIFLHRCVS